MSGVYAIMVDKTPQIMMWEDFDVVEPIYFNTINVCSEKWPLSFKITGDENHYMRLGRPVWYNSGDDYSRIVRLATHFLNNGDTCTETLSKLAAFMCVFGIEVRNNSFLLEVLCTYRMACIFGKEDVLGYLSEPVLVHGAHRILEELPNRLFYFLKLFISCGYVAQRTESVIARILILQRLTHLTPKDEFFAAAQTNLISLDSFLARIDLFEAICTTDENLKFGRIHFSHWKNLTYKLGFYSLVQCYYKGAGIICRKGAFDFIIPVFIDKDENHAAVENMKRSAYDVMMGTLDENEWGILKKMFPFIAIRVTRCSHTENPETFVQAQNEQMAHFSDLPGYILDMQMCCCSEEDEIIKGITDKKHCYIKRTGLEQWHLTQPEQRRASDLLDLE